MIRVRGIDAARMAAEVLREPGAVLLVPTETVYGLVCRRGDRAAEERIAERGTGGRRLSQAGDMSGSEGATRSSTQRRNSATQRSRISSTSSHSAIRPPSSRTRAFHRADARRR